MTPRKQLWLSSLITLSVLLGAFVLTLGTPTEAIAAPHPPTAHCDESNAGELTTTGGGFSIPQCPEGIYALWQCSLNGSGNYSWAYQGRHCGPIISVGF